MRSIGGVILIAGVVSGTVALPTAVSAQVIPQAWGAVGVADDDISYAVGARFLNLGVELGGGGESDVGVDVLGFVNLPFVSPYVGLGLYESDDETLAVSAGVQLRPPGDLFVGAGYHSLRGLNGQIGIKF